MVRRYRNRLRLGLSAAALVAVSAPILPAGRGAENLHSQASFTTGSTRRGTGDEIVTLQWVFRTGDLMTCRTSARDLRHARLAFGNRVQIRAVAVATEAEVVRAFLRGERLNAEVVTISEREYRRTLSSMPTPSVTLLHDGHAVELFTAGNLSLPNRRTTGALSQVLAVLLGGAPPQP
jgi:hypothetical protein